MQISFRKKEAQGAWGWLSGLAPTFNFPLPPPHPMGSGTMHCQSDPKTKDMCNLGVGGLWSLPQQRRAGQGREGVPWNRRQEAEQTAAPESAEMKRAPWSVACPGLPHSTPGNQQHDSAGVKGQRRVWVSKYAHAP